MDKITHFAYEYDFLSNFYSAEVRLDDVAYASVEHAYQAAKTLDPKKREIFTLEFNPNLTAAQAKKIGQKIELREDWLKVKVPIMHGLVMQKFYDPKLRAKLMATGDAYLEEGNNWHDTFWGVCYHRLEGKACKELGHAAFGGNHLGYILMDVRDFS
jgi:ribA/ribD-fused uncharacterized protein